MLKILLYPVSLVYRLVIWFRHKLFDWGVLKSEEFDIPIICVGNLTVGGTGKTPFAEFIIQNLSGQYNIALLSRGYRRRTKGYYEVFPNTPFREVGDEPKQIKLKFPEIVVAVCEDRVVGINQIRAQHPKVNLIILDDGFQHRYVEAWVNIVLMDYNRPIYNDTLLPVGRLRDLPSQLSRAHFVVTTKCPANMNALDMRLVANSLDLYPYQSLFFAGVQIGGAFPLFGDMAIKAELTRGDSVIAMAGLAEPTGFVKGLKTQFKVVDTLIFKDHHPYRMSDLDKMQQALENAPAGTVIVTTEKDAVKLTNRRRIPVDIQQRLFFIPINIEFKDDSQDKFLQKLNTYVRTNQKYSLLD